MLLLNVFKQIKLVISSDGKKNSVFIFFVYNFKDSNRYLKTHTL